jgi:hypothetical protein
MKPGITLSAIQRELIKLGKVNPDTGRPPQPSAIEKAAYVYVLEGDPQTVAEARKQFAYRKLTTEAVVVDDDKWAHFMLHMAGTAYFKRPKKFDTVVARHGLHRYLDQRTNIKLYETKRFQKK